MAVTISLKDVQDIRTVNIEGHGTLYVRKLGSGEELDLSFAQRRINKLIEELTGMDFGKFNVEKPEDMKKMLKMSKRADEIQDEISGIRQRQHEIYKSLLSDDKKGKVVDVIMNTLSDTARNEVFKIAFGEVKEIDTPETIESKNA